MAGFGQAMAGAGASSATDWHAFAASRKINRGAARKAYYRQKNLIEFAASNRHQWEVEDLRKAGLNPILSATGGSGGVSPGGAPMAQAPQFRGSGASALQSALLYKQMKKLDAEIDNVKARTEQSLVSAGVKSPLARIGNAISSALDAFGVNRSWYPMIQKSGEMIGKKLSNAAWNLKQRMDHRSYKNRPPDVRVIKSRSAAR